MSGREGSQYTRWRLPSTPRGLVGWGPLWPLADRVLFNTQSTVLTSPSQHRAHRACGTTPCIWFYWSDALRPKPCWHAQFHCSIIYRLRKGLQHKGQIASSTGQCFASSDGRMQDSETLLHTWLPIHWQVFVSNNFEHFDILFRGLWIERP